MGLGGGAPCDGGGFLRQRVAGKPGSVGGPPMQPDEVTARYVKPEDGDSEDEGSGSDDGSRKGRRKKKVPQLLRVQLWWAHHGAGYRDAGEYGWHPHMQAARASIAEGQGWADAMPCGSHVAIQEKKPKKEYGIRDNPFDMSDGSAGDTESDELPGKGLKHIGHINKYVLQIVCMCVCMIVYA